MTILNVACAKHLKRLDDTVGNLPCERGQEIALWLISSEQEGGRKGLDSESLPWPVHKLGHHLEPRGSIVGF